MNRHLTAGLLLTTALAFHAGAATIEDYRRIFEDTSARIEATQTAATNAAMQRYVAGLGSAETRARKAGDLEELMACRTEKKRLSGQRTVPEPDEGEATASIRALRTAYRDALSKAKRERNRKMLELLTNYMKRLEALKKELVVAEKIDRARAVKDELQRAEFMLAVLHAETPPATPPPAVPEPEPTIKNARRHPLGAKPFHGHWYQVYDETVSWHEAKRRCEEKGGHLVCIGGRLENSFVAKLSGGRGIWLGGTDEVREGQWRWVSGEPFGYSNWSPQQPNNWGGNEDYLSMGGRYKDQWNDLTSYYPKCASGYVCEWER